MDVTLLQALECKNLAPMQTQEQELESRDDFVEPGMVSFDAPDTEPARQPRLLFLENAAFSLSYDNLYHAYMSFLTEAEATPLALVCKAFAKRRGFVLEPITEAMISCKWIVVRNASDGSIYRLNNEQAFHRILDPVRSLFEKL